VNRKPIIKLSRAREPITWGDVEAANRAVQRRFWIYVGIVAIVIGVLFGWSWLDAVLHG
jgi:hypothetical protein